MEKILVKLFIVVSILIGAFFLVGLPEGYALAATVGTIIGAVNCVLIMGIGAKMLSKSEPVEEGKTGKKAAAMAGVMALKVFAPAAALYVVLIPFNMPVAPVIVGLVVGFASFVGAVIWARQSEKV